VITLERYHAKLRALMPDLQLPDLANERSNPARATELYGSCAALLRERTRDHRTFPVVFAENINFGFRRDLYGWKPVGLVAASMGVLSCAIFIATHLSAEQSVLLLVVVGAVVSAMLLLVWLFVIKPQWVRLAADAYAERLIRSLDAM
jgi:hypothetical protein